MLFSKSLVLAIGILPIVHAAPIADVEIVYETVTIFSHIRAEVPTGIAFYGPEQPTTTSEPITSNEDESTDDDIYYYPSSSIRSSSLPGFSSSISSVTSQVSEPIMTGTSSSAVENSTSDSSTSTTATTSTSSSTSTSIFDSSVVHSGVATYYSVGADNCGTSSTDSDYVCAISQQLYNTVANSESISEYCGHKINITYNSKTIQVTVVDSCESCDANHLDLSPTAFSALADQNLGVIDITWEWV